MSCPGFTLLKLSPALGGSSTRFWLREWVAAAPSVAAADSPSWIIYQGCCSSSCGSDAMSAATSVSVSFHCALLGPAHPEWHRLLGGLGNCGGSQQRGSRRAVASLYHQHPPTSSPANSNNWDVTKCSQESQTVRSQASRPVLPLYCLRSIIINYQFFRNAINLTAV